MIMKNSLMVVILCALYGCSIFHPKQTVPCEEYKELYFHQREINDNLIEMLKECLEKGEKLRRECDFSDYALEYPNGISCRVQSSQYLDKKEVPQTSKAMR